ncbi:MAG TPA: hypothetical protein VEB59_14175 [Gemmatimonadales bacterium]|nr:hypothetical protein [Gemmatimonadales bacterium]
MAALLTTAGCGESGRGEAPSAKAPAAPAASVPTNSAPANACGWITAAEAAAIIGPLGGEPVVVRSVEQPEPDEYGAACRYPLADQPRIGKGAIVLQVDLSGGIIEERVGDNMAEGFRQVIQAGTPAEGSAPPPAAPTPAGWDRVGRVWIGFSTFKGRIGHLAVTAAALTPEVSRDRTEALATRVRDAIPDGPFALPIDPQLAAFARAAGSPLEAAPSGPDPCSLLSAAEAAAVLGKLLVPPYRSGDNSALATAHGTSCTYFTAGHRAFTLTPHWNTGKMLFGMAKGVGGTVAQVAPDDTAAAADTLEGPWEEAAANGTTGQLYFLKGDRMLEVDYLTSSTDRAGAVRLARAAVEGL